MTITRTSGRWLTLLVLLATLMTSLVVSAAPARAEDARRISFTASVNNIVEVWTMAANGTDRRQVTSGGASKKCDPMLSPIGDEVVYADNAGQMLVQSTAPGSKPTNIAPAWDDPAIRGSGRRPTWSADGNTIVFHFSTDGNSTDNVPGEPTYNLWIVNRASTPTGWSAPRQLTDVPSGAAALHPRYSQKVGGGDWLVYSYRATASDPYDLYVAQVPADAALSAGGVVVLPADSQPIGKRITSGANGVLGTWSASQGRIAYATSCSGGVYLVDMNLEDLANPVASNLRKVTNSGVCGLSWSRTDENRMVYEAGGKAVIHDVSLTRRATTTLGTASMPSW